MTEECDADDDDDSRVRWRSPGADAPEAEMAATHLLPTTGILIS